MPGSKLSRSCRGGFSYRRQSDRGRLGTKQGIMIHNVIGACVAPSVIRSTPRGIDNYLFHKGETSFGVLNIAVVLAVR